MGVFGRLFGREGAGSFTRSYAVIDVETTGLSPSGNRVLELAVVRVAADGGLVDEWVSRFNPEGPVGATHIHGITDVDVSSKPPFRDVAAQIANLLAGLPVVAHNARFDLAFLRAEYQRAGWDMPWLPSFCTLDASHSFLPDLDRRRLTDCCWATGVAHEQQHSGLGDARATAGLLGHYLASGAGTSHHAALTGLPAEARSVRWPSGPVRPASRWLPEARSSERSNQNRYTPARPKQPPLVQQLSTLSLAEVIDEGAPQGTLTYLESLLAALEDGEISSDEADGLRELAELHQLTESDRVKAHEALVLALAHRALDDGHVSHGERAELHAIGALVDVPKAVVLEVIERSDAARAARKSAGLASLPADWRLGEPLRVGDKVAFTGCEDAQRDRLEKRAEELGVRVMGNISRLTAMLVTDGGFSGTKAARAAELGVRTVHPNDFEKLLVHLQPTLADGRSTGRSGAS